MTNTPTRKIFVGLFALLAVSMMLVACSSKQADTNSGKKLVFDCPAERTNTCTQEKAPVCGQTVGGFRTEYKNKCVACADIEVVSYVDGSC